MRLHWQGTPSRMVRREILVQLASGTGHLGFRLEQRPVSGKTMSVLGCALNTVSGHKSLRGDLFWRPDDPWGGLPTPGRSHRVREGLCAAYKPLAPCSILVRSPLFIISSRPSQTSVEFTTPCTHSFHLTFGRVSCLDLRAFTHSIPGGESVFKRD